MGELNELFSNLTTDPGQAYQPVGDPSQVTNINQGRTDQFMNLLMGEGGSGGLINQLTQGQGDQFASTADPAAGFNYFMNNLAPQLQSLTSETTSPFVQSLFGQADQQAGAAVQDVLSQFSGKNALYSGAAMNQALTSAGDVRGQSGR